MKYFYLRHDINPKIVGVSHGAGQAGITPDFLNKHDWFKQIFYKNETWDKNAWKNFANITKHSQPLNEIFMEKKSKLTDFIRFPSLMSGFIVNNRLKFLIESHAHLPNHKFAPVTFNHKGSIIDGYWWFVYDLEIGDKNIDFSKSIFDLTVHEKKFGKNFSIQSYDDYISIFYETGAAVRALKIIFNNNFDKELDIFGLQFLSLKDAYISERLLKIWQSEKITGYVAISKENRSLAAIHNNNNCDLIID